MFSLIGMLQITHLFISYIGSINWLNLFNCKFNINDNLDTFYSHIEYAITSFVPKVRKHELSYPAWFIKELIILIKKKKYAHHIFKISKTPTSYSNFSNIRNKCITTRYHDYNLFINKTQSLI